MEKNYIPQGSKNMSETGVSASMFGQGVSRREFLKLAGVAGVTVGMCGALGSLLAGCGEEGTTETTAETVSSTAPATQATQVTTGAERGRNLKVGVASPRTGAMAVASVAEDWWVAHAQAATADGIICKDGKLRQIDIVRVDNQSDSNRAAQVTGDLIMNAKVDIVLSFGWPDGVVPAADQCETHGTPGLFAFAPWQCLFQRDSTPKEGYKWIWGVMMGSELTVRNFVKIFDQVPTNKKVGMLFANDADAQAWMQPDAAPAVFEAAGYELVVPSYYPLGAEDFTTQISEFKKQGCEIVCGTNNPPDFVNFWKQAVQQGFRPKLVSTGKALNFPEVPEELGEIGYNIIGEIVWVPYLPFKDSLTGQTVKELAEDFEAKENMQWRYPIGDYALFEWAVDIFKRASNPEDKEALAAVIPQTKLDTIYGPIDFTAPVDPNGAHNVVNNVRPWLCCGQWVRGTGKWKYEMAVCAVCTGAGVPPEGVELELHTAKPMEYPD